MQLQMHYKRQEINVNILEKYLTDKFTIKQVKKIHIWLRAGIQLFFFLLFPSAYTAAFAGIKYIFTQIGAGEMISISSFVTVLIVLCGYTIIFGRFFCGFACAFGTLGDAIRAGYVWCCKKLKKKPVTLSQKISTRLSVCKYLILLVIVLMCYAGIYSQAQGTSPWDVFSMIHAGNLKLANYIPGLIILLLILVGMRVQERFFCRFLCPMGAIFSLLPVLPVFSLRRDRRSCIPKCSGCTKKCPSDIQLPEHGSWAVSSDCFQCQKCIDICPKSNVHCAVNAHLGKMTLRGNEILFTLLRTLLLIGIFLWLGI